jgi:hypothetical protein|tara:strand:+ start:24 stop:314 length:291 start_codon:yes stop_codon:yes gene_type:complete
MSIWYKKSDPSGGEGIDPSSISSIKIAYKLIKKFPNLQKKHKVAAGGVAISSALIILSSIAIVKRLQKGQSLKKALNEISEEEIEAIHIKKKQKNQ